jgi:hypothetical protein
MFFFLNETISNIEQIKLDVLVQQRNIKKKKVTV